MRKLGARHNTIQGTRYTFIVLCILLTGFMLRFNNLSQRSLWTDEFFTFFESTGHGLDIKNFLDNISSQQTPKLLTAREFKVFLKPDLDKSFKDVSQGLLYTDTHAPLYFWIMHLWIRVFSDNILTVRLFSLLMGMISVFLSYKVCAHLFTKNAALFSALFTSISAFSVRYAQEARPYALIIVLGLSSWWFVLRFQKQNRNSDAICFIIFNCLGFYAHYFYLFIAVSLFAYFTIANYRDKARLDKFYLAFLLSLLFFSPWAILLILKGYKFYLVEWLFGYPGFHIKLYYLFRGISRYILISSASKGLLSFLFLSGLLLFAYIGIRAYKEILTRYLKETSFCLVMFLVPLLGMFCMDIVQQGALLRQERFWTFAFLGFIPLAGYFLDSGFSKTKPAVYLVIILMLISSFTVSKLQFGPAPKYASTWINKESQGVVSAVIVYNIRSVVFSQSYYLDDDIYLIPVSDQGQLDNVVKAVSGFADKLFIARHYHHSDASLMNKAFLDTKELGEGFKFETEIKMDDISVSEFIK
ncbi:MAG: glycosyltransferase family 39 protein [Candidatus Omnitrophica bacterium]|nr:glycosyltransferase family 39 protein [Candidatus Omnitrophota bacterium]